MCHQVIYNISKHKNNDSFMFLSFRTGVSIVAYILSRFVFSVCSYLFRCIIFRDQMCNQSCLSLVDDCLSIQQTHQRYKHLTKSLLFIHCAETVCAENIMLQTNCTLSDREHQQLKIASSSTVPLSVTVTCPKYSTIFLICELIDPIRNQSNRDL